MKRVEVDGQSEAPFDCPYCGREIEYHETASPKVKWEILQYNHPKGELDAMDCPKCGKRFELLQKL